MENLKLSADWPLVPLSSAKGGAHPCGGTIHAIPDLHKQASVYEISFKSMNQGEKKGGGVRLHTDEIKLSFGF